MEHSGVECEVEGKNKEIKIKKVRARVWRKWQGKRGKKKIKKKKLGVCVWRKKKERNMDKKIK